jgi:two-component system, NarL family, sensor histidine kinase DegS
MERSMSTNTSPWDEFEQELQTELDQSRRSLKEVSMMLEQSQAELTKLTQKNSTITGQLQQINAQFETIPRADIRNAFMLALDVQQRLLVMRGQLEKLQSDQVSLQRYVATLEKSHKMLLDCAYSPQVGRTGSGSAVLEMVINGQEIVRQRLSQQMHDGPAQALSNFILQTEIATRMFDLNPEQAKEELSNLRTAAMSSFQKVRAFITELRPMMLDDLGLFPTLRRYVDVYKEQTGQDVNLIIKGHERRLESYLEVMIFRAVQELIGNSARHNQDTGKLQTNAQVIIEENQIRVTVVDNGKGFDTELLTQTDGLGLKLIRERVEMLGGFFEIDSTVGQGCKVSFQVPALEAARKPK